MTLTNKDLARIFANHSCKRAGCEVDESGDERVITHRISDEEKEMLVTIAPRELDDEERKTVISSILVAARKDAGMSQNALAKAAGVSAQTVIRIEGGTEKWGLDAAFKVARVLGIAPADLIEGLY
jgi:DNA-binding XRE family transcriptional regulator